jgi:hypothetical protein
MVVALSALDAHTEEQLRDRLGSGNGSALRAVKIRGRVRIGAAARDEYLTRELIQWLFGGDTIAPNDGSSRALCDP